MATIPVRNSSGAEAGTVEVSDAIFGIEPNESCVKAAYDAYRANQRQGTHSTKTRGMVRGGGRKPYRQKGTGRARQGSIRAAQWRGGSIIFGPMPRDYTVRLNRKVRQKALASMFSDLAANGRIVAVEDFALKAPKTNELAKLIKDFKLNGFVLIIHDGSDENLLLSARNLPYAKCAHVDALNVFDLLTHDFVLATRGALERMGEIYA